MDGRAACEGDQSGRDTTRPLLNKEEMKQGNILIQDKSGLISFAMLFMLLFLHLLFFFPLLLVAITAEI